LLEDEGARVALPIADDAKGKALTV